MFLESLKKRIAYLTEAGAPLLICIMMATFFKLFFIFMYYLYSSINVNRLRSIELFAFNGSQIATL